jgi:hypothetical protein
VRQAPAGLAASRQTRDLPARIGHLNAIVVIESARERRLISNMKALLLTGAIAFIVITAKATQQAETESAHGLRMSLAHDEAASGPDKATHFTVTFSNLKREDVTLSTGLLVDCGRPVSRTSFINLNLTDSKGKRHRHLPYLGDGPPYQGGTACGNGVTLFVAVLHPGESLSFPLDIGKYLDLADSKQYDVARFPAGVYSLQVELRPIPSDGKVKYWAGTLSSNALKVHFESEFAAPLDDYPE